MGKIKSIPKGQNRTSNGLEAENNAVACNRNLIWPETKILKSRLKIMSEDKLFIQVLKGLV